MDSASTVWVSLKLQYGWYTRTPAAQGPSYWAVRRNLPSAPIERSCLEWLLVELRLGAVLSDRRRVLRAALHALPAACAPYPTSCDPSDSGPLTWGVAPPAAQDLTPCRTGWRPKSCILAAWQYIPEYTWLRQPRDRAVPGPGHPAAGAGPAEGREAGHTVSGTQIIRLAAPSWTCRQRRHGRHWDSATGTKAPNQPSKARSILGHACGGLGRRRRRAVARTPLGFRQRHRNA